MKWRIRTQQFPKKKLRDRILPNPQSNLLHRSMSPPEEYEEEYDEGENRDSYDDYDEANEDYHESYDDYDYENDDYSRYDDEDDPYNSDHFDESEETKVISDDQLRFSVEISALPGLDDVNSIDVFVFIYPFIHFLL